MTFYLKYRPQKIDELDIAEVRDSLTRTVASGKIPHAFLFSGPKGTGKTSAARIIAKILNCESKVKPCNRCLQCTSINKGSNIDVIELDAASHRGIEDVRLLRDAVKLAPAKAKNKVYIIDEVHMLTPEAANALLKTLEEPPEHVTFILATTNPEKLIDTIRSRTTNINFTKASAEEIVRSLTRVVKGEKIKIKPDGLNEIAKAAGGSFRDGVKVLEQLAIEKRKLDAKSVSEFLFQTKEINIGDLIKLLIAKETKAALLEVEKIISRGVSTQNLAGSLLTSFRESLLGKMGIGGDELYQLSKSDILTLIRLFSQAAGESKSAILEQLPLEIAIVEWCESRTNPPQASPDIPDLTPRPDEVKPAPQESQPAEIKAIPLQSSAKEVSEEVWKNILAMVKPLNTSIEALLRAARPMGYDGKILTLGVYYRFHKERLEETSHRRILEDVVTGVMGAPVKVICTLTEPPAKPEPKVVEEKTVLTEGEDEDIIKIAEEIFGN
jgi:DNA polymerase-3 subunit gamma/tau